MAFINLSDSHLTHISISSFTLAARPLFLAALPTTLIIIFKKQKQCCSQHNTVEGFSFTFFSSFLRGKRSGYKSAHRVSLQLSQPPITLGNKATWWLCVELEGGCGGREVRAERKSSRKNVAIVFDEGNGLSLALNSMWFPRHCIVCSSRAKQKGFVRYSSHMMKLYMYVISVRRSLFSLFSLSLNCSSCFVIKQMFPSARVWAISVCDRRCVSYKSCCSFSFTFHMLLAAIHAVEFSSCCFFIYDYFPWIFFFSFPSSLCCFAKGSIVIGAEASLSLARRDMQIERICGFFGGRERGGRNHSMAKCVSALCEHWASWV